MLNLRGQKHWRNVKNYLKRRFPATKLSPMSNYLGIVSRRRRTIARLAKRSCETRRLSLNEKQWSCRFKSASLLIPIRKLRKRRHYYVRSINNGGDHVKGFIPGSSIMLTRLMLRKKWSNRTLSFSDKTRDKKSNRRPFSRFLRTFLRYRL